jgi:hypothetical protein
MASLNPKSTQFGLFDTEKTVTKRCLGTITLLLIGLKSLYIQDIHFQYRHSNWFIDIESMVCYVSNLEFTWLVSICNRQLLTPDLWPVFKLHEKYFNQPFFRPNNHGLNCKDSLPAAQPVMLLPGYCEYRSFFLLEKLQLLIPIGKKLWNFRIIRWLAGL